MHPAGVCLQRDELGERAPVDGAVRCRVLRSHLRRNERLCDGNLLGREGAWRFALTLGSLRAAFAPASAQRPPGRRSPQDWGKGPSLCPRPGETRTWSKYRQSASSISKSHVRGANTTPRGATRLAAVHFKGVVGAPAAKVGVRCASEVRKGRAGALGGRDTPANRSKEAHRDQNPQEGGHGQASLLERFLDFVVL